MARTRAMLAPLARGCVMLGGVLLGGAVPAPQPHLSLHVEGLRSERGNVLVCLTADPKSFPDCRRDPGAVKRVVRAGEAAEVDLGAVAPGGYALALIHDENGNGKLDTRLMIPSEGFGFSRNPTITFGPPRFRDARFELGDDATQRVRMKYML